MKGQEAIEIKKASKRFEHSILSRKQVCNSQEALAEAWGVGSVVEWEAGLAEAWAEDEVKEE